MKYILECTVIWLEMDEYYTEEHTDKEVCELTAKSISEALSEASSVVSSILNREEVVEVHDITIRR